MCIWLANLYTKESDSVSSLRSLDPNKGKLITSLLANFAFSRQSRAALYKQLEGIRTGLILHSFA